MDKCRSFPSGRAQQSRFAPTGTTELLVRQQRSFTQQTYRWLCQVAACEVSAHLSSLGAQHAHHSTACKSNCFLSGNKISGKCASIPNAGGHTCALPPHFASAQSKPQQQHIIDLQGRYYGQVSARNTCCVCACSTSDQRYCALPKSNLNLARPLNTVMLPTKHQSLLQQCLACPNCISQSWATNKTSANPAECMMLIQVQARRADVTWLAYGKLSKQLKCNDCTTHQ